jgi:hypothetical protein
MSAKPKVTLNLGYFNDGKRNKQVRIATSNLFIDTDSPSVDYMTGAVFDGIGGNEFINSDSASVILQQGNTLIQNSSDILEETSSTTTEKQPDNEEAVNSQFALRLKNFLPETIGHLEYIGSSDATNSTTRENTKVFVEFPEKNIYFDDTYQYIYIELDTVTDTQEVEVEFITSTSLTNDII